MIILLLLILSFESSIPFVSASSYDKYFARVMYDDVYLYKSALDIDEYSNVYFELPRTYFVELLEEAGAFFKVNYLTFTGYVKKESVQTIVGTPITPYLSDVSFRIYSEQSRSLRTEPTELGGTATLVTYIPLLSRNLTYYGEINGASLIEGRTNIWYYCKYTADKDYYGYVYSDFCDELSQIKENTESVTYTSNPTFQDEEETATSLPISDKTTPIIIAILCVPALVFVFMILKSSVILNKEKRETKEVREY